MDYLRWASEQVIPPLIARKDEITSKYKSHKEKFQNDEQLQTYILSTYLNEGKKQWAIVKNDFPYNVDSNITHFLLWINPNNLLTKDKIDIIVKDFAKDNEVVYFQNHVSMQSIKSIPHYHIFIAK